MSMRRTRERFVGPLKEGVGGFVEGSMGVKGYYQHLYLVVAPTMSNVACYGPQMWLPKAYPASPKNQVHPLATHNQHHHTLYKHSPTWFRKLGTGISTHALRAHK